MTTTILRQYTPDFRQQVLDLTVDAWGPVFPKTRAEVPGFVYDAFWPDGWQPRQIAEVGKLLDDEPQSIWLARQGGILAGFVGVRLHPEDQMGEIHILAVAPAVQRRGIAKALLGHAEDQIKAAGMKMIMVETTADSGHAPARQTYEDFGFQSWPVARYFKEI